jgi:glycosyltransferase involved in cell wall biosynthesis
MTRISIAMATYNGERFLAEQLDSLAAQTLLPDELVIGDDGSSDATEAIVRAFAAKAPFPVSFNCNPERLGFSRNFERALSLCSGDVILMSDQDDIWDADKIARVAEQLAATRDAVALIHDERILDEETGLVASSTLHRNVRRLGFDDRDIVSGNCTALRRDYLQLLFPFPASVNHDYWIGWTADALAARLVVADVLQTYRRHGDNASNPVVAGTRPSRLGLLLTSGFQDGRPLWDENLRLLKLIAGRLSERRAEFEALVGNERVSGAMALLNIQVAALDRRYQLASIPRWRRWPTVIAALASGFYSQFSGLGSAVTDCLRR